MGDMTEETDNMLQIAMEQLKQMPDGPEKDLAIEQLFQDYPGLENVIAEQLNQADRMTKDDSAQGINAGGQFVAASPMAHMSSALKQGIGAYGQQQAYDKMGDLSQDRTDALSGVAQAGLGGIGAASSVAQSTQGYMPRAGDVSKEQAIADVLRAEGGYVNDPSDRGGETNMGISSRSYPDEDIAGMTTDRASEIYGTDYWDAADIDSLPPESRGIAMDSAVNQGVGFTRGMLQETGGDFDKIKAARDARYNSILENDPSQAKYRKGWKNRLNEFGGVPVAGMEEEDEDEWMSTMLRGYA